MRRLNDIPDGPALAPAPAQELVLVGDDIPASRRQSAFERHRWRSGAPAVAMQTLSFISSAATVVVAGIWAGPLGVALVGPIAAAAFWSTLSRVASLGNERLRSELAERLGAGADAEFVGLCRAENNTVAAKLLTLRLETDDNVGFLSVDDNGLRIRTEEGLVAIDRDAVRRVSLERFAEMPYLRWIAVEHYQGPVLRKILVCSRGGDSLRSHRDATLVLHARLVQWYLEPYMAEALAAR